MNDAVTTRSPARIRGTVGNSQGVQENEKPATFSLNAMWRAFQRPTSQERTEAVTNPPIPRISLYIAHYGTLIPLSKAREGVSATPSTTFGYDHTANRVLKAYNNATTFSSKYHNIEITNYATSTATTTKSIFTPTGELIATVTTVGATSTRKYIHTDHLGGMNAGTDSNGDTVEIEDTYPYGASRISETYGAPKAQRQYAGTERDFNQSMDYMVNRYYSYDRGQFISQDPVHWEIGISADGKKVLLDPQLQNSYGYARNNPIIYKDANGRISLNIDGSYTHLAPGSPPGFSAIGPMTGVSFSTQGIYTREGVSLSIRPGPSWSITISGDPSEGYGSGLSGFGLWGIWGGQAGMEQGSGGKDQISVAVGAGSPGVSWDTYKTKYAGSYSQLFNALGGKFSYVSTPQTNGMGTGFMGGAPPAPSGMPNFKGTYDYGGGYKYDYGKGQWITNPSSGSGSGSSNNTQGNNNRSQTLIGSNR